MSYINEPITIRRRTGDSYTVPLISYINCQALCIAGYSNYYTVLIISYIKSVVIFSGKTSIIILY